MNSTHGFLIVKLGFWRLDYDGFGDLMFFGLMGCLIGFGYGLGCLGLSTTVVWFVDNGGVMVAWQMAMDEKERGS